MFVGRQRAHGKLESREPFQQSTQPAPPSISLPKGGGATRGMGEKFAANPVTGTGSINVPIAAQNPVGNLISLPFQNNANLNFGPEKGAQTCGKNGSWIWASLVAEPMCSSRRTAIDKTSRVRSQERYQ